METQPSEWYARPLINKVAELRVVVMFGKVVTVLNKEIEDTSAVAWNAEAGATYSTVKWGQWNMLACHRAMQAAKMSGLDYASVDIMVEEGTLTPWVCEVNSAGSCNIKRNGEASYRAKCVARALAWHLEQENYNHFFLDTRHDGWRDVIHPGIWGRHPANQPPHTHESVQVSRPEFVSSRGENA